MRYSVNGAARTHDGYDDPTAFSAAGTRLCERGFNGTGLSLRGRDRGEFKLLGADYPAEFGRSLGSVLNVVSPSPARIGGTEARMSFSATPRWYANGFFEKPSWPAVAELQSGRSSAAC